MSDPFDAATRGPTLDRDNPYPGLHPFEERDRVYFFGRDQESSTLLRMVRRRVLTMVFGRSGLGKTSLLNAGLAPELRDRFYFPVTTRFDFAPASGELTRQLLAQIAEQAEKHGVECPVARDDETLWEYLHRAALWDETNQLLRPVLILDQFEEIFTLGAGDARVARLVEQLGDAVENRTPEPVKARLLEADEELPFTPSRQEYKIVLSLREDFLPHLEGLARRMPTVMENRFRLTAMTAEQARDAIVGPWQGREGAQVVTAAVAEEILRNVAGGAPSTVPGKGAPELDELSVEPALLSLFCRELNERRKGRAVSKELVATSDDVFGDFYERCVSGRPPELRRFIEDDLLTDRGFRKAEVYEDVLTRPGIEEADVTALVDQRLLRIEDRLGIPHLELIHDRLTEVVHRSRERRRERELAAARVAQQRRRIAWVAGVLVVTSVGFGLWANAQAEQARLTAALDAEAAASRARLAQSEALLAQQEARLADSVAATLLEVNTAYDSIVKELQRVATTGEAISSELADRIIQVDRERERVTLTSEEPELVPPTETVQPRDRGPRSRAFSSG